MARTLTALLLAVLLGWWLWPRGGSEADAPRLASPPAPAPASAALTARGGGDAEAPEAPERAVPDGVEEDDLDEAPRDGPLLEGTIVVEAVDGSLHRSKDGEILMRLVDGKRETRDPRIRVAVEGGAFRLRLGAAVRLGFERVRLGGRPAALRDASEYGEMPVENAHSLRAVWKAATRLHVLDAESGEPLRNVHVTWGADAEDVLGVGWIGRAPSLVVSGSSPLDVPGAVEVSGAEARAARVVVRAEGYAFKRVALDIAEGGTREVRLERAGALRLVVERRGDPGRDDLMLRLTRPEEEGLAEDDASILAGPRFQDARRIVELDHLAAGPWQVELSHRYRTVFRDTIEIVAGQRTERTVRVTLPQPAASSKRTVRLDLDVVLADGWRPEDLTVLVGRRGGRVHRRPLVECTPIDGETWRWSLDVSAHRWFALVEPTGVMQLVLDPARPDLVPRVRVPAPGTVTVQCVWKDDQRSTSAARLRWRGEDRVPGAPWAPGGLATRLADGRFRLHAPPMRVRLRPYQVEGGYTASTLALDVTGEGQEVRFELERLCEVRFELYDEDTRVPWHVGHDDRNTGVPLFETERPHFDFDGRTGTILVGPPGRWRFALFPGPDYRAPAPIELDVVPGPNGVHRVPLRRR